MKTRTTAFIGILIGFFFLFLSAFSQVKYQVMPKAELKVTGTSTLHGDAG